MVNIWFVRPGEKGRLWNEFKENNCIAIGWNNAKSYNIYQSLDSVKQDISRKQSGKQGGKNDANSIWYFYNDMKKDDVVVVTKSQKGVLGIGKITSDYIDPDNSKNPKIEYRHIRFVDWLIVDNIENLSFNIAPKTITQVNSFEKWDDIKIKYIKKDPKYKEILEDIQMGDGLGLDVFEWGDSTNQSILDNILPHSKNVILYGPPGTGKTYTVQQFIESFLDNQLSAPKSANDIKKEHLHNLKWYDIIALAIYLGKNEKVKVADLKNDELITFYYEIIKDRTSDVKSTIWSRLRRYSNPHSKLVIYDNKHDPFLFDRTEDHEWYLIPDGIDYVETNLSDIKDILEGKSASEKRIITDFCTFITFHQSYGYEDFIEGLKPEVNDGNVLYNVKEGVFKEISEKARDDPENNYVLVIDEINRGNIAKIFGELITLIEDDKRCGKDKQGLSVELPYSKTEFSVPSNLYIIGTMNTADRSIALLDIALRRRFTFIEMMPDSSIIKFDVGDVNIGSLLEGLNTMVSALIDRDHQIGHSYFCEIKKITDEEKAKDKLRFVWYRKIIPLLQEYFYNDWEQLKLVLGDFVKENKAQQIPALEYKSNKTYEIEYFDNDWNGFSKALNKISIGEQKKAKNEENIEVIE
jgi:DNA polymerase III delta prime subunit